MNLERMDKNWIILLSNQMQIKIILSVCTIIIIYLFASEYCQNSSHCNIYEKMQSFGTEQILGLKNIEKNYLSSNTKELATSKKPGGWLGTTPVQK